MSAASWKKQHSKTADGVAHFAFGAVSSAIANGLLQPFDVVKTRLITMHAQKQLNLGTYAAQMKYRHTAHALQKICQEEGRHGLWRGFVPTVIRVSLGAGVFFATLNLIAPPAEKHSNTKAAVSGAFSRFVAALLMCPVSVVKTRFEASRKGGRTLPYTGLVNALITIGRTERITALYSGLLATLIRDMPYAAMYYAVYLKTREFLKDSRFRIISSSHVFLAGLFAGGSATFLTQPADVVKTHRQVERRLKSDPKLPAQPIDVVKTNKQAERQKVDPKHFRSVPQVINDILQKRGIRGLFRGAGPRVVKRAGAGAITWTMFEFLWKMYSSDSNSSSEDSKDSHK